MKYNLPSMPEELYKEFGIIDNELKKNIITDLELINTFDNSCNTIYSFCFNTDNDVSKKI